MVALRDVIFWRSFPYCSRNAWINLGLPVILLWLKLPVSRKAVPIALIFRAILRIYWKMLTNPALCSCYQLHLIYINYNWNRLLNCKLQCYAFSSSFMLHLQEMATKLSVVSWQQTISSSRSVVYKTLDFFRLYGSATLISSFISVCTFWLLRSLYKLSLKDLTEIFIHYIYI